jgi:cysteinyl-tRNA synthetase
VKPFRIYNTLERKLVDFEPIEPGKIGIYVCGMTVYDDCHVGHARAMVVFDTFVRYLRHRGWEVTFVRNFTDVDDKIIERSAERGMKPMELADHYIERFYKDLDGLGAVRPNHEPRVSTSIDAIIELVGKIIENGNAYVAEGNVWFDVGTDEAYGKLSNQKIDELRNPDDWAGKRSPVDFALWKATKPGEPSWESPWGPGRPGWHIECSAMARSTLGDTIDIHGGGLDLVFPHHENEIAQSECGTKKPYARYWMHNGMLTMDTGRKMKGAAGDDDDGQQKMSKSLGNVFNVHDALEKFPAEALRLYYLQNHYRSPLPWTDDSMTEALAMLSRLYDAREKAENMTGNDDAEMVAKQLGEDAQKVLELGRTFENRFYAAADTDFNTAQALGYAFELARAVNRFANHKKAKKVGGMVVRPALEAFELLPRAFGLLRQTSSAFHSEVKKKCLASMGLEEAAIDKLLEERIAAREAKDWERADAIRDDLTEKGIEVLDLPHTVEWRVKLVVKET